MKKINFHNMFLMGNQRTTCPHCGSRTEIISDMSHTLSKNQVHLCPDAGCQFEFVLVEDDEVNLDCDEKPFAKF